MTITKEVFGKLNDRDILIYTITNKNGLKMKLSEYGATIVEMWVPDRNGKFEDVICGFDTLEGYIKDDAKVGSVCGRTANRIAFGKFSIDGVEYTLATNLGRHNLHGGNVGLDKRVWESSIVNDNSVKFTYFSPDGEEGFPGNVNFQVTYTLNDENEIKFEFEAKTDKKTPINITNHGYWNLAGSGTIYDHELQLFADKYTEVDEELIPTGKLLSVEGTPLDFYTKPMKIGSRISQVGDGYDHNFCIKKKEVDEFVIAARVVEPQSGRVMEIYTTEPGIQLYTANWLNIEKGKRGKSFGKHHAFCLETQHYPDSVHHPNFPSIIVEPEKLYKTVTVHKFLIK